MDALCVDREVSWVLLPCTEWLGGIHGSMAALAAAQLTAHAPLPARLPQLSQVLAGQRCLYGHQLRRAQILIILFSMAGSLSISLSIGSWLLSCAGAPQQLLHAIAAVERLITAGVGALVTGLLYSVVFELLQAQLVATATERRLASAEQQGSGGQQPSTSSGRASLPLLPPAPQLEWESWHRSYAEWQALWQQYKEVRGLWPYGGLGAWRRRPGGYLGPLLRSCPSCSHLPLLDTCVVLEPAVPAAGAGSSGDGCAGRVAAAAGSSADGCAGRAAAAAAWPGVTCCGTQAFARVPPAPRLFCLQPPAMPTLFLPLCFLLLSSCKLANRQRRQLLPPTPVWGLLRCCPGSQTCT